VIAEYEQAEYFGAQPARASTRCALRVGQRADRRSVRIPLCSPRPGRRAGSLRSRRTGGLHYPADFRLGRSGANKLARNMPSPGPNGLPDPAGHKSMASVDDPRHAQQSSLYRSRGLRSRSLLAGSPAVAAPPRTAESRSGRIGPISLGMKQMGERSAGTARYTDGRTTFR
jgi:hypothetical protein